MCSSDLAPRLARLGVAGGEDAAGWAALVTGADARGQLSGEPFGAAVTDFYLTNPIARASAVMAECSALAQKRAPLAAE